MVVAVAVLDVAGEDVAHDADVDAGARPMELQSHQRRVVDVIERSLLHSRNKGQTFGQSCLTAFWNPTRCQTR